MIRQAPLISTWHECISGFTQTVGRLHGLARLRLQLHQRHTAPGTAVEKWDWNSNWHGIAEDIWMSSEVNAKVYIYAYSWGAGHGAMELAKGLKARGMNVECMVLSDPVYHDNWLFRRWRAFWPFSKIQVPDNVREVCWFRQKSNLPAGHDLQVSGKTILHDPIWVDCKHEFMDDLELFHQQCMAVADASAVGRVDREFAKFNELLRGKDE